MVIEVYDTIRRIKEDAITAELIKGSGRSLEEYPSINCIYMGERTNVRRMENSNYLPYI
jgi:hypothetical protein